MLEHPDFSDRLKACSDCLCHYRVRRMADRIFVASHWCNNGWSWAKISVLLQVQRWRVCAEVMDHPRPCNLVVEQPSAEMHRKTKRVIVIWIHPVSSSLVLHRMVFQPCV